MFGRKRIKAVSAAAIGDGTAHSGIWEADPYAFHVAHRRASWLLRLSVVMNVMLAGLVAVSVGAIASLVPLKQTDIALVKYADDDRLLRIEPMSPDVDGFELYLERFARRWVGLMLEMDGVTQVERMRQGFAMSSREVAARFDGERHAVVMAAVRSGVTRTVTVETSEPMLSQQSGVWKFSVDALQRDYRDGEEIEARPIRVYVAVARVPSEVAAEDRFENPLGVKVVNYSVQPRRQ